MFKMHYLSIKFSKLPSAGGTRITFIYSVICQGTSTRRQRRGVFGLL